MPVEPFSQRSDKRDDGKWWYSNSEYGMADEDGKINRPHNPLPCELHRANVVMIDKIGNEEQARSDQGSDHCLPVCDFLLLPDEVITEKKKECAGGVEYCVDEG
jgi:hypothetical protein